MIILLAVISIVKQIGAPYEDYLSKESCTNMIFQHDRPWISPKKKLASNELYMTARATIAESNYVLLHLCDTIINVTPWNRGVNIAPRIGMFNPVSRDSPPGGCYGDRKMFLLYDFITGIYECLLNVWSWMRRFRCLFSNFPHLTLWENSIYARNSNRSCVPGRAAGHSELDRWIVRWCRCWPRITPCHMENP